MAGTDNHRNSGSRKVNMKIWGGVPSFSRNLSRHQLSCLLALWLLSYNDKKKKKKKKEHHGQNAKTIFVIIWPKSGNLMKYLVHRLLLTCSVLSNH